MRFPWGHKLKPEHPNQRQEGARFALLTLSALNLLNFADRYIPSAVKPLFQEELGLSDVQTALPASAMGIVYMLCAPVFGLLADANLVDRRYLLAAAVVFWSMATGLAALSQNLWQLVFFRSLVGVGEAAYTTISAPLIADFYPIRERNMAYTIFGLTMPLGGALGYAVGAVVGGALGWRASFWVCGMPGIAAALFVLFCNDPPRGINDPSVKAQNVQIELAELRADPETEDIMNEDKTQEKNQSSLVPSLFRDLLEILFNFRWLLATAGYVACSFAIGGMSDWSATFLYQYQGMGVALAGTVVSGATLLGGLGGTVLGAKVADAVAPRLSGDAYFLVPALFTLPAAVLLLLSINMPHGQAGFVASSLVLFEICFFTNVAPLNSISITAIPNHLRAKSSGLQILMTHVLGDVISPPIVGAIADAASLRSGMQILWMAVGLAGLFWFLGYFLTRPSKKEQEADHEVLDNDAPRVGLFALLCKPHSPASPSSSE